MGLNSANRTQIQAGPPLLTPEEPARKRRNDDRRIDRQRVVHVRARDRQARGEREPDGQVDGPEKREDIHGRAEPFPHAPAAVLHCCIGLAAQSASVACVQQAADRDDVGGVEPQ